MPKFFFVIISKTSWKPCNRFTPLPPPAPRLKMEDGKRGTENGFPESATIDLNLKLCLTILRNFRSDQDGSAAYSGEDWQLCGWKHEWSTRGWPTEPGPTSWKLCPTTTGKDIARCRNVIVGGVNLLQRSFNNIHIRCCCMLRLLVRRRCILSWYSGLISFFKSI